MENKLPISWVWARVGKIIEKISLTGKKIKQGEYQEYGKIPVIDQGQNFIGGYTDKRELIINCKKPLVIFGDHTKVVKYVDFDFVAGADGVKVIKPQSVFNPKLFYYFVQAIQLPEKGYARHFQFLEKSFIPLPPLNEQHRIVAKIEELFTELGAGFEALKKVKAELKRYRQAVLKYAFEGKLTEEWRKNVGADLRVCPEKNENKKEGEHTGSPLQKDLPELPEGWVWARLGEVVVDVEKINPKDNPDREFVYLDIASIDNTEQKITNPKKYLGKNAPSRARQLVKAGDILFSTVRTYLKNIAQVSEIYDGQIASTGFCVIRPHDSVHKKFIFYFVQTDFFLNPLTQIQRGTSYPAVRDSDVFAQVIPLPPLPEQHQIVEEIERRFSVADEVEKVIDNSLKQAQRLRQSILKRAFEGRLVPQDPADEPAGKLLERIRQEREKAVKGANGRSPLRKKNIRRNKTSAII